MSKNFNKDTCFPNLKISNISENVDCNIRESRGKTKELTYLSGHERIREIKDCEIIDLKKNKKIKVKDIFDL